MQWWHAILLGIVEGLSEFLPISSTGHLTVVEKLLGYQIDDAGITAFTAIIQVGAILAAVLYFIRDIVRLAVAWFRGLFSAEARADTDYRLGWAVIVGSIPIAVVGLVGQKLIEGALRNLWVVAAALILWSVVLFLADRASSKQTGRRSAPRGEESMTVVDALIVGLWQCVALIPGVSRSGATISGALFRGIDRVTATRWSFFLGIPALVAAGGLETVKAFKNVHDTVGWVPTLIGTAVAFVVAYASIAWLLRFVAHNRFTAFVVYRVLAGLAVVALLAAGIVTAR
ncbi:MAG TPA: undecaprenyl-diphosphate phosphatase [Propionibacteriaceae bacterium]|nr:undecaprenyl-diphosphate phosphatase [Propionibacteriaceae bacterium]